MQKSTYIIDVEALSNLNSNNSKYIAFWSIHSLYYVLCSLTKLTGNCKYGVLHNFLTKLLKQKSAYIIDVEAFKIHCFLEHSFIVLRSVFIDKIDR